MRALLVICLMLLSSWPSLIGQEVIIARRRTASVGPCTPPAANHIWPAYNPANTCTGGVACTNGAVMSVWNDTVGTIAGNINLGVATYATNQQNSLPAINFNSGDQFNLSSGGVAVGTTTTMYAMVKPASTSGTFPIFGASSGSNSIEWRIFNGQQQIVNAGIALLLTGTATLSTSSFTTIEAVVVNGTSASLFICSGGSCVSDGTTSIGSQTFSSNVDRIGTSGGDTPFQGSILEAGMHNGTLTGVGAYSLCKYAI